MQDNSFNQDHMRKQRPDIVPDDFSPSQDAGKRLTPVKILLLAGMAFIAFALTATIVVLVAGLAVTGKDETSLGPVSLLPREPDGVTVVAKQPDENGNLLTAGSAPQAAGADVAEGYAIELGSALSFAELSARFAVLASQNAEAGLDQLEPRATLAETENGLEALLLVGPYKTMEAASEACQNIALPQGIDCKATGFKGELISRE